MNFLLHQNQLDFLLHMYQHLSSSLSRFLIPWFRISAPVPGNLARLGMVLKTLSTCISFSGNLSFTCAMMMSTKLSLIPLKRFFVPDWSLPLWFLCVHNRLFLCGKVVLPNAHQDFPSCLWLLTQLLLALIAFDQCQSCPSERLCCIYW